MIRISLAFLLVTGLASCAVIGSTDSDPGSQFGHREEDSEGGRITTVIEPADNTQLYRYVDAFVDDVQVRPAPPSTDPIAVEILVKGAFPDACTELHEVSQLRSGNLIDVTLQTRRPQNALCASVLRPYRFYLILDGTFVAGPYTLRLNGSAHPFEVHAPETEAK